MEESNDDSSQGNAKRVKFDMENESTCTMILESADNEMIPTSSTVTNITPLLTSASESISSPAKRNEMPHMVSDTQKQEDQTDKDTQVVEACGSTSENAVQSSTRSDLSNAVDSDDMESDQPASAARLSHFTRNYRRRIVDESSSSSSSDDEESSNRNTRRTLSTARPAVDDDDAADGNISESLTYSPGTPSISSESSVSGGGSGTDWIADDSDSTFESNDRFRFEPNEEIDGVVETILQKQKPKYAWYSVPSIMYRQNGFSSGKRFRHTTDTPYNFQAGVRGSLHGVERLEQLSKLSEHFGCINCLNFSQNGKLLASGSDDLKIKIWNWARKKAIATINTSHVSNIFQAKFIDYNGYDDGFEMVSSDQSGAVRHYSIGPCGSVRSEKLLHGSPRAVHKLGLPSNRPYEVLSAGEDSRVMLIDLREGSARRLVRSKCSLYSIACHPLDSNSFCVGGQDQFVRVYDRRSVKSTVRELCPEHLMKGQHQLRSVTSAVYNYVGTEILASYSNENVYLFDSSNDKTGDFLHKYCGHRNNRTIKGVNFYGPRSEFVISGSENPGHVFFWEKQTEAIVQMMVADVGGVVNCLEPHPSVPILATSGLADEIRLWHPSRDKDPNLSDLRKFVHRNMNIQLNRQDRNSGIDIFQFILQRMRRRAEEQFENRGADGEQNEQASDADSPPSNATSDDDDSDLDHSQFNSCNAS